jgi:hypothetical protein
MTDEEEDLPEEERGAVDEYADASGDDADADVDADSDAVQRGDTETVGEADPVGLGD